MKLNHQTASDSPTRCSEKRQNMRRRNSKVTSERHQLGFRGAHRFLFILFVSLIVVIISICNYIPSANGQFLFTYEINQESDDSRAPKSSLFDPSSFRIVTPAQLQSSYQKMATQTLEPPVASNTPTQFAPPAPTPQSVVADSVSDSALIENNLNDSGSDNSGGSLGNQQRASITAAPEQPQSLLKQTSAALQSFAELFSLSSPTSSSGSVSASSSPAPTTALGSNSIAVDQEAEARSLQEHWSQQQQKSHQSTLNSLSHHHQQPHHHHHQHQHHHHHHQNQQPQVASAALQSFTTSQPAASNQLAHHHQQQQQQPSSTSQASYWLTANPLNSPDGNYLVEIKQNHRAQEQQQQPQPQQQLPQSAPIQVSSPASLVDNLLAVGQRSQGPAQHQHHHQHPRPKLPASSSLNLAQASFLATPTSYYPNPNTPPTTHASPLESTTVRLLPPAPTSVAHQHHSLVDSPPAVGSQQQQHLGHSPLRNTVSAQASFSSSSANQIRPQDNPVSQLSALTNQPELSSQSLQPPANLPEHYVSVPKQQQQQVHNQHHLHHNHQQQQPAAHLHKSAEESLNAFRQQQNTLFTQQNQLANQHNHQSHHQPQSQAQRQQHQQQQQQQQQPQAPQSQVYTMQRGLSPAPSSGGQQQQQLQGSQNQHLGEIPKVSPQIYESFLLQQKDQHEKHMELLKQQQELNKLLEQKHKQQQQEAEVKAKKEQRRKKEELDQAQRKKSAIREQELAQQRKLKLEQEEREQRRRRDEEERKRAAAVAQQELEQRKYREALERERRERERQLEEEARELKARQELEAAEKKRQEEVAAALKKRKEKEAEEAKYLNYLRQQEELRKLLELKQKEEEMQQQRRRQAAANQQQQLTQEQPQQQQQQQKQRPQATGRHLASQLAREHRERIGAATWGTPIRSRSVNSQHQPQQQQFDQMAPTTLAQQQPTTTTTTTTQVPLILSTSTATSSSGTSDETHKQHRPQRQRARLVKKQRTMVNDKLIRQKIPLYSGPGQYGLYRGNNDSSIANDLAALLDSVTLPAATSSTSTTTSSTTSTSTTTTPAPSTGLDYDQNNSRYQSNSNSMVTPSFITTDYSSSSLSPLLTRANLETNPRGSESVSTSSPSEPFFDDDVPRRPARGLSSSSSQSRSSSSGLTSPSGGGGMSVASSIRQQTTRFNESLPSPPSGGRAAHIGLASLPADSDNDGIPGRAGVEYPVLSAVPQTSFSCSKQPLNGYYADTETACQVVHLCQGGVQSSILCPNGTIFNQEKFSCQWWYEVNCSRAPIFYQLNDNLYKSSLSSASSTNEQPLQADELQRKKHQVSSKKSSNHLASSAGA